MSARRLVRAPTCLKLHRLLYSYESKVIGPIGNYTTRDKTVAAQAALRSQGVEAEIKGTSVYGLSVVITGTNTILFQFDDLGLGTGLGVEPNAADTVEDDPVNGKENNGEREYRESVQKPSAPFCSLAGWAVTDKARTDPMETAVVSKAFFFYSKHHAGRCERIPSLYGMV